MEEFTSDELEEDRRASYNDIKCCRIALLVGVTRYSGGTIQSRIDTNQRIIEVIEKELNRRNSQSSAMDR